MSAEVGEGAVLEPVGDTLPVDGLLAHAGNHLRDVDEGTCRTTKLYSFARLGQNVRIGTERRNLLPIVIL